MKRRWNDDRVDGPNASKAKEERKKPSCRGMMPCRACRRILSYACVTLLLNGDSKFKRFNLWFRLRARDLAGSGPIDGGLARSRRGR